MGAAREEILDRVRAAVRSARPAPVPRRYRRHGTRAEAARIDLLCERAAAYEARVHRVSLADLESVLALRCAELGARRLVVAPGVPWRPPGTEVELDEPPIAAARLDRLDGVLTGCAIAIAETGTVVLDGGRHCGRRALTLVPDLHLCVVDAESIVETVAEATGALAPAAAAGAPITMISGPSATSDIELRRVDGVHGPRKLELFVACAPIPSADA